HLDACQRLGVGMVIGTTDVSRTGIKRLLDGSNEALFNNSEWLLANQVASTHKLVFNNRANKALYKWAVTEGDPEVAYPLQEGEEPRSGFQAISHFAGGHMIKVAVRNEIATPWLQSDAALRPDLANAIRVVTGGSLFRVMVTGANLTFAFRNFPRDVGHVLMFTNTYSNMLPRALAEMGLDLAKVSGDAFKRKGRYQEYMEEGGSMDFLTRQGRPLTSKESIFSKDGLLRRKTIAERGLDGFMHFAGYINETSEIVVRLAVREREISKLTDAFVLEKGREPDASELKWIKEQATAKAREYMDFNQGGEWAKAVDSAIPYLNAGFQGTRVMARYIKTNPKVFAWKMAQLSALTAMIMAHNLGHE
ncbi:MAG TPA: hypothetical protein P5291_11845, partial [Flavobacteriales bacterium]|nr:hypothetical protein [Flavobacteriales bacterium]